MTDEELDAIEARVRVPYTDFEIVSSERIRNTLALVAEVRRLRAVLERETSAREATRRGYEMARDYAARLREALKPFAALYTHGVDGGFIARVRSGDVERAREALREVE